MRMKCNDSYILFRHRIKGSGRRQSEATFLLLFEFIVNSLFYVKLKHRCLYYKADIKSHKNIQKCVAVALHPYFCAKNGVNLPETAKALCHFNNADRPFQDCLTDIVSFHIKNF